MAIASPGSEFGRRQLKKFAISKTRAVGYNAWLIAFARCGCRLLA
jgi:hypothetical protein